MNRKPVPVIRQISSCTSTKPKFVKACNINGALIVKKKQTVTTVNVYCWFSESYDQCFANWCVMPAVCVYLGCASKCDSGLIGIVD